jgi:hypothetical protein
MKLREYLATLGASVPQTKFETVPQFRNTGAGLLSGAMTGAKLGGMIPGISPGLGAGIGGILGGFY